MDDAPDDADFAETSDAFDDRVHHVAAHEEAMDDEEEEEEECRVCRGPAEEGRPLFKPCKCSGSIGLTHQDCLTSWLNVTRGGGRCELCSHKFQFAPKYADGAPDRLPPAEVFVGLARRAAVRWLPLALRALLAASLWLCALPLATAYLYQGWMRRPSSIAGRWNWELVAGDAVSGAVVAAVIVLSFLSLMSFADFLRFHWQNAEEDGAPLEGGEGRREELGRNAGDEAAGQEEVAEEEEEGGFPPAADEGIDDGFLDHDDERLELLRRHALGDAELAADPANGDEEAENDASEEGGDRAGVQLPFLDRNALGVMDQRELFFPERMGRDADREEERRRNHRDGNNERPAAADRWRNNLELDDPLAGRDLGRRELLAAGALRRQRQRELLQRQVMFDREMEDNERGNNDEAVFHHPRTPLHRGADEDAALEDVPGDEMVERPPAGEILPAADPAEEEEEEELADMLANMIQAQEDEEEEEMMRHQHHDDGDAEQINRPGNDAQLPQQGGNNDMFEPQFEPLDPVFDQDEPADVEIHVALDELLGLRGPLAALIRNLLWLVAFNTTYLGLFAFIPHTIGSSVYSTVSNSTAVALGSGLLSRHMPYMHLLVGGADSNQTGFSLAGIINDLNEESRRVNTLLRLPEVGTISLGYFSMALMVFMWQVGVALYKRFCEQQDHVRMDGPAAGPIGEGTGEDFDDLHGRELDMRLVRGGIIDDGDAEIDADELDPMNGAEWEGEEHEEAVQNPVDIRAAIGEKLALGLMCAAAIVKVGILLFLKMLLLPLLLGIWLDAATLVLFGSNVHERIMHAGGDLFGSVLLHWVVGITFMLLVTVSVLQLREVAHPELLARVIRPQEPQPDLLGNLLQEDGATHAKRMLLSLGIYAALLSVHVWLPAKLLVFLGVGQHLPFFRPKFWHIVLPQLQVPLELLVFHLSMLAFLEKYKNHIGDMQHTWLLHMCRLMGLTEYVLPRDVDKFELVGWKAVFLQRDGNEEVGQSEDVAPPLNLDEDTVTDATSSSSAEEDGRKSPTLEDTTTDKTTENKRVGEVRQSSIRGSAELDPFWAQLLSLKDRGGLADDFICANMQLSSELDSGATYEIGDTKGDGTRVLDESVSYIRLPSPSKTSEHATHPDGSPSAEVGDAGSNTTASSTNGFLLPTVIGAYRLRRRVCRIQPNASTGHPRNEDMVIEFWREVPGKPIVRPPEGWDDLGVGGAEVQGRWAWENERKSEIETGVARRTVFFPQSGIPGRWRSWSWWKTVILLMLKLALLLALSWLAVLFVVCVVASAPLAVGRGVFFLLRIPDRCVHDPMAFAIGGAIIFPCFCKLSQLFGNKHDSSTSVFSAIRSWLALFRPPPHGSDKIQVLFLTVVIWLVISPLFLGLAYNLFLQLEVTSLTLSWGAGMLLLHLWAALCYLGALTREFWVGVGAGGGNVAAIAGAVGVNDGNADARAVGPNNDVANHDPLEQHPEQDFQNTSGASMGARKHLKWQGDGGRISAFVDILHAVVTKWEWEKVDRAILLEECAFPIFRQLATAFIGPVLLHLFGNACFHVISGGRDAAGIIFPFIGFVEKGRCRMFLFRFFALVVISTQLALAFQSPLRQWFQAAHKAARDDRYLVGEILLDYLPPKQSNVGTERKRSGNKPR